MFRFARIVFANYRRIDSFKNQIVFSPQFPKSHKRIKFFFGSTIMTFFTGKKEEELEKQETDLIMTIKRGIRLSLSLVFVPNVILTNF